MISRIPFLSEPIIPHLFFHLLHYSIFHSMNSFHLCSRPRIPHIRHPLPLHWFNRMIYPNPTRPIWSPSQLVSQLTQFLQHLLRSYTTQRNVFKIAVDICACYERMVVTFHSEAELYLRVLFHERSQLGWGEERAYAWGWATEVAEVEGEFA